MTSFMTSRCGGLITQELNLIIIIILFNRAVVPLYEYKKLIINITWIAAEERYIQGKFIEES